MYVKDLNGASGAVARAANAVVGDPRRFTPLEQSLAQVANCYQDLLTAVKSGNAARAVLAEQAVVRYVNGMTGLLEMRLH